MRNYYFKKYLKQKEKLPEAVRSEIQTILKDEILFYALGDFSKKLELAETWIVLGQSRFYVKEVDQKIQSFSYLADESNEGSLIVREQLGNVANSLSIAKKVTNTDEVIIVSLWYSKKQNVLFSQIKFILEEKFKNIDYKLSINPDELYQEGILRPLLKNQSSMDTKKKKVVWRLLTYLMPYRSELIIGCLGAIGMTLVNLVPAYLSGRLIDETIKPFQDGILSKEEAMSIGFILIASMGVISIIKEGFVWLRLKKMSILGEKVARDLRRDLFEHLQTLDMDYFGDNQTGNIISRVSSDTDRIWDFVAFGIIEVSISLITLISLAGVLISLDVQLGLIMTIPVPFLIFAIFRHGQKMQKIFIRCWRKWSEMTSVLSDTIPGIQVVKSFNQESREIKRFSKGNEAALIEFNKVHHTWTTFWPGLMLAIQLVMISVWVIAMPRLLGTQADPQFITAGTFVSFILYMTMFFQPIETIGQMARMLNRATSSAYRIFEVLDTKPSLDKQASVKSHELKGEIEFRNVIFSYDGIRNVLKGINFTIGKGEMIGLVGPSGSGKSTITKLINRFYDISSGEILLDGHKLKDLELGPLRKQIAVVHQDPFLFHGPILENIRYGNDEASLLQVIEASKIANAHEFIVSLKDGYDTVVGERGHTLSGGERQRISIARAVLNDPKILILDEATSAVDTETERKIQDALDQLTKGRTVIAIAHRLSTLRKANRIFVIKSGELVEVGSHSELMNQNGEYCKLQSMQMEMFEIMHGKPVQLTTQTENVNGESNEV